MGSLYVSDLNDRERRRFAATFRSVADAAVEAADALEREGDSDLALAVAKFGLFSLGIRELYEILAKSSSVNLPDHVPHDLRKAE